MTQARHEYSARRGQEGYDAEPAQVRSSSWAAAIRVAVHQVLVEFSQELDVQSLSRHRQTARSAVVTGTRAGRSAGSRPPNSPIPKAHATPIAASEGVTAS